MASIPDPKNLLGWIRLWCERPGMFLVGAPDYRKVNVSILRTWIYGYDLALHDLGHASQHRPFLTWLHERRPDLKHHPLWYGEALLQEAGDDDHERVIATILKWVEEFEASGAVPKT
jgi:hypothetical protein